MFFNRGVQLYCFDNSPKKHTQKNQTRVTACFLFTDQLAISGFELTTALPTVNEITA